MTADVLREDRDTRAADVGMWLFVASLVMFFGALFSGYVLLRAGSTVWPTPWLSRGTGALGGIADPWFRLLWLVVAAIAARAAAGDPDRRSIVARYPLPIAALSGAIFVARTWSVGRGLIDAGQAPASNVAAASWFALNGVLAVLVAGGVIVTVASLRLAAGDARPARRARLLGRYWLLMAAFGVVLVVGMYLV